MTDSSTQKLSKAVPQLRSVIPVPEGARKRARANNLRQAGSDYGLVVDSIHEIPPAGRLTLPLVCRTLDDNPVTRRAIRRVMRAPAADTRGVSMAEALFKSFPRWRRTLTAGVFGLGLALSFCLVTARAAEAPSDRSTATPAPAQQSGAAHRQQQPDAAHAQQQPAEAPEATSAARVRLISQEQYFNTLSYVFGPDISVSAHFAPFRRTDGLLEIGAATAGVTSGQMQEFQRTAVALADKVVSPQRRNFLIPCTPSRETQADKRCAGKFLSSVGRLL
jgi:hypothetical protein